MERDLKIAIGCDLAAYDFKTEIVDILKNRGYNLIDVGCNSSKAGDYTTYAKAVADLVASNKVDRGIVMCGTGQGICMAANKIKGIRAALCYTVLPAILSREHNNSNILATGAWMVTTDEAIRIIEAWLFAKYSGGRHDVRIEHMKEFEENRTK